jgi:hypothetical protein
MIPLWVKQRVLFLNVASSNQQMMTSATTKIESEIIEKGYCHLSYSESKAYTEVMPSLGSVIQKTEITENPNSTRLLVSNQGMDYHTDHYAARYIAWFCHSQAAVGGHSILIDSQEILKDYSERTLNLLQEISVNTHQVFLTDKLTVPLLTMQGSDLQRAIYYAQWLVNIPASHKHQQALGKFQQDLRSTQPTRLLLSEGELLIIDNHRMLHGRDGFPSKSNRWLTRYWIRNQNS